MDGLQMEKLFETFSGLENATDFQDVPQEHREEFSVFMRIMKARTLRELKGISYETIMGFFEKIPLYASYLDIKDLSMSDLQMGFYKVKSENCRRVL